MRIAPLVVVGAALAGCASGSEARGIEELRAQARALVPASSRVVDTSEGSCVEIAGGPPCARIFLVADLPEDERADALERTARAAGWEVERSPRRDGTLLELRREGYLAYAAVWDDERSAPCRTGQPERSCADELQVIERG